MEAFQYAIDLGYRYVETDCHLTKDGVVVAFHDPELDRVSNEVGPINTWLWEDLQQITINDTGTMASISQLLEEFPTTRFNIDVKSDEVTAPLLAVLDKHSAFDRVCIGSFSDSRLSKVRRAHPGSACTSFGPLGVLGCIAGSFGLPFKARGGNALQISPTFRGAPLLSERLIEYAHEIGLAIHIWTIDDVDEMHRLLDMGVDGIMTDRPSVLQQVFTERGLAL